MRVLMCCCTALWHKDKQALVCAAVNFSSSLPFSCKKKEKVGGWHLNFLFIFSYLSRSLSRSRSLSLLWLRTGDCPLAMEWWEMGGDALAGLEEEVVEEELLVERSRPPPPPPPPVPVLPLLLCLMPLSSMLWPPPPVTSFHNCWSSAGLRPASETRKTAVRQKLNSANFIQQPEKLAKAAGLKAFPSVTDYHPVLLHCRPQLELILYWSIKTSVLFLFLSAQLDTDFHLLADHSSSSQSQILCVFSLRKNYTTLITVNVPDKQALSTACFQLGN